MSGIVWWGGEQTECPVLDNIMTPINYRRGRHCHHGHLPQLTPQMDRCSSSLPTWPARYLMGYNSVELLRTNISRRQVAVRVVVLVQDCKAASCRRWTH